MVRSFFSKDHWGNLFCRWKGGFEMKQIIVLGVAVLLSVHAVSLIAQKEEVIIHFVGSDGTIKTTKNIPGGSELFILASAQLPSMHFYQQQEAQLHNFNSNQIMTTISGMLKDKAYSLGAFYQRYKYRVWFGSFLTLYLAVTVRMKHLERFLEDKTRWSLWHNQLAMHELFAIPEKRLLDDLTRDIKARYAPTSSDNQLMAFMHFVEAVRDEIKKLETYRWWHAWITRCHLSKIFWIKASLVATVQERLDRAAYLKSRIEALLDGTESSDQKG